LDTRIGAGPDLRQGTSITRTLIVIHWKMTANETFACPGSGGEMWCQIVETLRNHKFGLRCKSRTVSRKYVVGYILKSIIVHYNTTQSIVRCSSLEFGFIQLGDRI
jgi:hypothetical protein